MEPIEIVRLINFAIALCFALCYSYQFLYIAVPFFKRDKPLCKGALQRYAVLIAARNEREVIGELLESIKLQDYPHELVTVFVVADNCTDDTASIARSGGAVVYERFDEQRAGKGYALDFLTRHIENDYGEDAFEGFFVFDADNLLRSDYITEMNKTFSQGYGIVTGYRNSKNYGDNWISAGYSLWFLRESEFLNHSRSLLGTSCAVSGTGFLFSREVLKNCGGWSFFLLTEDIEFTIHNILAGERVGYCASAVIYDEQPVKFSQSWRQRLRWAKGYIQVFQRYGARLTAGIFRKNGFACFDMCMAIMPAIVLTFIGLAANIYAAVLGLLAGQDVLVAVLSALEGLFNTYCLLLFIGGVTTATQWKSIRASAPKKLLYTLTLPLFMLTYIPISFTALFSRVEWKPIEHRVAVSIAALEGIKGR